MYLAFRKHCCACVCVSVAQKQCCLSSVKESQCESDVISARGGDTCEVDEGKQCTDDSYQVYYYREDVV